MERIINLQDLLSEQLRDRFNAAEQQVPLLEDILGHSLTAELIELVEKNLENTHAHKDALAQICADLEIDSVGEICEGTQGLIHEARELIERAVDTPVLEAGIVISLQHINHHDIAGFGSCRAFATALQNEAVAAELGRMLQDEKESDELLTELALAKINQAAVAPVINY